MHLLYFTKLSGKSQDFYFLVGIHLNRSHLKMCVGNRWSPIHISHGFALKSYILHKSLKFMNLNRPMGFRRSNVGLVHVDVIRWKHFPRYWPFVRGIHRSPVDFSLQRPVTRSFEVFFDLSLNKRLSKHLRQRRVQFDVTAWQTMEIWIWITKFAICICIYVLIEPTPVAIYQKPGSPMISYHWFM